MVIPTIITLLMIAGVVTLIMRIRLGRLRIRAADMLKKSQDIIDEFAPTPDPFPLPAMLAKVTAQLGTADRLAVVKPWRAQITMFNAATQAYYGFIATMGEAANAYWRGHTRKTLALLLEDAQLHMRELRDAMFALNGLDDFCERQLALIGKATASLKCAKDYYATAAQAVAELKRVRFKHMPNSAPTRFDASPLEDRLWEIERALIKAATALAGNDLLTVAGLVEDLPTRCNQIRVTAQDMPIEQSTMAATRKHLNKLVGNLDGSMKAAQRRVNELLQRYTTPFLLELAQEVAAGRVLHEATVQQLRLLHELAAQQDWEAAGSLAEGLRANYDELQQLFARTREAQRQYAHYRATFEGYESLWNELYGASYGITQRKGDQQDVTARFADCKAKIEALQAVARQRMPFNPETTLQELELLVAQIRGINRESVRIHEAALNYSS